MLVQDCEDLGWLRKSFSAELNTELNTGVGLNQQWAGETTHDARLKLNRQVNVMLRPAEKETRILFRTSQTHRDEVQHHTTHMSTQTVMSQHHGYTQS